MFVIINWFVKSIWEELFALDTRNMQIKCLNEFSQRNWYDLDPKANNHIYILKMSVKLRVSEDGFGYNACLLDFHLKKSVTLSDNTGAESASLYHLPKNKYVIISRA